MRLVLLLASTVIGCGAMTESSAVDASLSDAVTDAVLGDSAVEAGANACLASGGSCGCAGACGPGATHGSFAQDNGCPQPCPTCGGCSMWCCVPTVTDAGFDAAGIKCSDPSAFPSFSKTCSVDGDCAFGLHQVDCCGSLRAVGFERTQPFADAEKAWASSCPMCDCLSKPTVADDGKTGTSFGVRCSSGTCSTFVK